MTYLVAVGDRFLPWYPISDFRSPPARPPDPASNAGNESRTTCNGSERIRDRTESHRNATQSHTNCGWRIDWAERTIQDA